MNWITKLTTPGVKSIFSKKDTPDNLWVKCPKSGEMVFAADMPSLLHVTPAGHHMRIGPSMRMDYTFDHGEYEVIPTLKVANDPLKFKDDQKYVDRLKKARNKTGNEDAMNIGVGNIHGIKTVVLVQNFAFMGGSLGMAAGEGFIQAAEYAIAHKLPMVVFTAAGGARMQEGALSLMQMPRTTIAVQEMRENGVKPDTKFYKNRKWGHNSSSCVISYVLFFLASSIFFARGKKLNSPPESGGRHAGAGGHARVGRERRSDVR